MKLTSTQRSVLASLLLLPGTALAIGMSDLEDLALDGYAVIEKTNVDGDYEGCEYDLRIPLMNGMLFVCQEYSYSYAYMPDVLILQSIHTGDIKVMIDGEELSGSLYQR